MHKQKNITLIAGPTASGKSQLAVDIAQGNGGVVINADSMQVYDTLHVLTARPDEKEMAGVPHYLYGFVSPARSFSTGLWLQAVADVLLLPEVASRPWVFVGGTGLYFRTLLGGLSRIPPVPPAVREKWRLRLLEEGAEALHMVLTGQDPAMAARLMPADGQRIVRALEILEATGQSLAQWQEQQGKPLIDTAVAKKIILLPDRAVLVERINRRFDKMVEHGALEEVKALRRLKLASDLPVMKAIGVRELGACLDGVLTQQQAIEKAKIETRRYAKRQATWFRHQLSADWQRFTAAEAAFAAFSATSGPNKH
ncbi:MAG: tRNA dimethylallyltransferase [Candidatus Tokpelaia hoelldobleri]|uniref:tRNA dimethylallyltransferase n=1 Tax=Candidatus Tokpelaia hoelldobleri TaxID=1902579 RepID=A0A1U9JVT1_9HYPH|nr:MAG: tRNA dimethylallyltransferase [Candidatus Tokpelaia hoelldoblerii]